MLKKLLQDWMPPKYWAYFIRYKLITYGWVLLMLPLMAALVLILGMAAETFTKMLSASVFKAKEFFSVLGGFLLFIGLAYVVGVRYVIMVLVQILTRLFGAQVDCRVASVSSTSFKGSRGVTYRSYTVRFVFLVAANENIVDDLDTKTESFYVDFGDFDPFSEGEIVSVRKLGFLIFVPTPKG